MDDAQNELDELLRLASDPTHVDPKPTLAHVRDREILAFIRAKGIEAGTQAVPVEFIFAIYKKWSKDPLKNVGFTKHLRNFLTMKRINKYNATVFYIDPRTVGLHETYTIYRDPHYYKSFKKEPKMQLLGVYLNRNDKITVRIITPQGAIKVIRGNYPTLKAAAAAYDKYAIELFGKNAIVNNYGKWKDQLNDNRRQKQSPQEDKNEGSDHSEE